MANLPRPVVRLHAPKIKAPKIQAPKLGRPARNGSSPGGRKKQGAPAEPENRELIGRLRLALEPVTPWTSETTEAAMRAFADQNNLKLAAVAQPLRVALTGRTTSPGIFDVLAVLGRQECLARLGDQAPS